MPRPKNDQPSSTFNKKKETKGRCVKTFSGLLPNCLPESDPAAIVLLVRLVSCSQTQSRPAFIPIFFFFFFFLQLEFSRRKHTSRNATLRIGRIRKNKSRKILMNKIVGERKRNNTHLYCLFCTGLFSVTLMDGAS